MYIHWTITYANPLKMIVKNFRRTINVFFSLEVATGMYFRTQGVIYVFDEIKKISTVYIYDAF